MQRTTSYTEFNAALINRTKTAGFNFDLDADRAVIGELLGQISEGTFAEAGGLLISALVQYLDANDAGSGFYALAKIKGLPVPTTDDCQLFGLATSARCISITPECGASESERARTPA
jgi:hypothetical protein